MAKTFKYGGYTFEPQGQFKDFGIKAGKNELHNICKALHSPRHPENNKVADGEEQFVYEEFYKASGDSDADVFYCLETGEMYVPCGSALQVFDQNSTDKDVEMRYHRRQTEREERETFAKREALKNAMCLTEEQRQAYIKLRDAVSECVDMGMQFVFDGDCVHVFRGDLLRNITNDIAPLHGQVAISDDSFMQCITGVWNAIDGLYANVKD